MLKVEMQIWWQRCFNSELIENMVAKKQTKNMLILAAKKQRKNVGNMETLKTIKIWLKQLALLFRTQILKSLI